MIRIWTDKNGWHISVEQIVPTEKVGIETLEKVQSDLITNLNKYVNKEILAGHIFVDELPFLAMHKQTPKETDIFDSKVVDCARCQHFNEPWFNVSACDTCGTEGKNFKNKED